MREKAGKRNEVIGEKCKEEWEPRQGIHMDKKLSGVGHSVIGEVV